MSAPQTMHQPPEKPFCTLSPITEEEIPFKVRFLIKQHANLNKRNTFQLPYVYGAGVTGALRAGNLSPPHLTVASPDEFSANNYEELYFWLLFISHLHFVIFMHQTSRLIRVRCLATLSKTTILSGMALLCIAKLISQLCRTARKLQIYSRAVHSCSSKRQASSFLIHRQSKRLCYNVWK